MLWKIFDIEVISTIFGLLNALGCFSILQFFILKVLLEIATSMLVMPRLSR